MTRFNDIQFLNENLGWAVNGWGQIYHTPDGGDSWELQFEQPMMFADCTIFCVPNTPSANTTAIILNAYFMCLH